MASSLVDCAPLFEPASSDAAEEPLDRFVSSKVAPTGARTHRLCSERDSREEVAISSQSGLIIAMAEGIGFRLSGRFERPAQPGFIVTKIPLSGLIVQALPISSIL